MAYAFFVTLAILIIMKSAKWAMTCCTVPRRDVGSFGRDVVLDDLQPTGHQAWAEDIRHQESERRGILARLEYLEEHIKTANGRKNAKSSPTQGGSTETPAASSS
jgi:hypothetical protein